MKLPEDELGRIYSIVSWVKDKLDSSSPTGDYLRTTVDFCEDLARSDGYEWQKHDFEIVAKAVLLFWSV